MGRLDGKIALITGAARGMGAAEARLFAAEGAAVAVCDVRDELAEAVAGEINQAGGRAQAVRLDVRSEEQWAAVTGRVWEELGGLDILVNNAGIDAAPQDAAATALEDWDAVIAVNQTGSFLGIKHAVPLMRRRGGGAIVQVSSTFAVRGVAMLAAYTASKGAVAALARHAAIAYAADNIRVNSIHPGLIDTPMIDQALPGNRDVIAATPLARLGRPEEIARAVLFLASDDASYITGASLFADGGYTAKGQNQSAG
ncbi:MAG: SDR family NAD(P)-dependent oxidoreductase [Solirubrobacteraceae bacterium]